MNAESTTQYSVYVHTNPKHKKIKIIIPSPIFDTTQHSNLHMKKVKMLKPLTPLVHKMLYKDNDFIQRSNNLPNILGSTYTKTFSYTITEVDTKTILNLCETDSTKLRDLRCKHMWLAPNTKKNRIFCAGICVFQDNTLYMDNLSGTYKPPSDRLEKAVNFLDNVFSFDVKGLTPLKRNQISEWKVIFIFSPNLKDHLSHNSRRSLRTKRKPSTKSKRKPVIKRGKLGGRYVIKVSKTTGRRYRKYV